MLRLLAVIFLFSLCFHDTKAQDSEDSGQNSAQQSGTAKHHDVVPTQTEQPALPDNAAEPSDETANQNLEILRDASKSVGRSIAEQDLHAQQRMADGTDVIAKYTPWQFWLGFGGAGLLLWTLYETRQTARAARDQVRQNRAWVGFKRAVRIPREDSTFDARFYIANFGDTPARKVVIRALSMTMLGGEVDEIPIDEMEEHHVANAGVLYPQIEYALTVRFDTEMVSASASNECSQVVFLTIDYETIYGQKARSLHSLEVVSTPEETSELAKIRVSPIGGRDYST